jgi:diguanylate cyclase (GGDEF)-like protein
MPNNGASSVPHRPYEKERKTEMERSLAKVRLFYIIFCSMLLFAAFKHLSVPLWKMIFFAAVSLCYGFIRYFKPANVLKGNRLPPAADLLDFVFVGVLIYLTSGIKSFFHVAHALPICGSAIRYGAWGGITGYIIALAITAAMFHIGSTTGSFPLQFHIIAGIGTLAFATWLVIILTEKERQLRNGLYLSSITDSLTGLYNSAYLRERVKEEIRRYYREGESFTLAFLDLDSFKKVNDKHGHLAGDGVLRQVAELLKKNTRGQELLVRYGGDEFVLLMPGANKEEGERTLMRIKRLVQQAKFPEAQAKIGISGGIATFPDDGTELDQLLVIADERMYEAKNNVLSNRANVQLPFLEG